MTSSLERRLLRDGEMSILQHASYVAIPPHDSKELSVDSLRDGVHDLGHSYRFGPPTFDVAIATLRLDGELQPDLPLEARYITRGSTLGTAGHPRLQAHATQLDDASLQLRLSTRADARAIVIEALGYVPEDQYFNIALSPERLLKLRPIREPVASPRGAVYDVNDRQAIQIKISR